MKAPAGPNYSRYSNPEYDGLYEQLVAATVDSVKMDVAGKADALLMRDAACVPLYYDEVVRVYPKGTTGLKTNALNAPVAQRGYSSSVLVSSANKGGPTVVIKG